MPMHRPNALWCGLRGHRRLVPVIALVLSGCVVVPRTAGVYDPKCRMVVQQVVLETEVIGHIGGCANDGCVAMLAAMGLVTAASAVISGSVAIIGNLVYWGERRGQCPQPLPGPIQGSTASTAGGVVTGAPWPGGAAPVPSGAPAASAPSVTR